MFADNLKALLKDRNVTQKQLAEYLGVKPNTVSDWLKQGNSPKIEHLCRIGEYFQVDMGWLLTGVGQQNSKTDARPDIDQPNSKTDTSPDIGQPNNKIDTSPPLGENNGTLDDDEKLLLQNYRDLDEKAKNEIQGQAARMAVKAGNKKLLTSPTTAADSEIGNELGMIG